MSVSVRMWCTSRFFKKRKKKTQTAILSFITDMRSGIYQMMEQRQQQWECSSTRKKNKSIERGKNYCSHNKRFFVRSYIYTNKTANAKKSKENHLRQQTIRVARHHFHQLLRRERDRETERERENKHAVFVLTGRNI
jgi:hypothetical protein